MKTAAKIAWRFLTHAKGQSILIAVGIATLLWMDLSSRYVWLVLGVTFAFGAIECSMRTGPMTVASAWAFILFRSEADTTRDRWSSRNTKVARFARGKQSNMLSMSFALPSGSSGRQTAGDER